MYFFNTVFLCMFIRNQKRDHGDLNIHEPCVTLIYKYKNRVLNAKIAVVSNILNSVSFKNIINTASQIFNIECLKNEQL